MLIRTAPLRTLVVLVAVILAAPALASAAPANDLAALFGESTPVKCTDVSDPVLQPGSLTSADCDACDQWYTVNSYARKLVDDCRTATQADYDAVTAQALINTNSFGTQVCSDLGCVHTASGANPDVNCSCNNRILLCSVNMEVYCD